MESAITYSLRLSARALVPLTSEKAVSKWMVGTNSLREENEVRVLQYDPDQERLVSSKSYVHGPEIWDIAPCPTSQDAFLTVWSKAGVYGASLWQADSQNVLQQQSELPGHDGVIRSVLWHRQETQLVVTIDEGALHKWSVSDQGVKPAAQASAGELLQLWGGALHPSSPDLACTLGGNNVQLWDLRTMEKTGEIVGAHRMPARDVSFASQEHRIVSAGDDCKLRFWDTRVLGKSEPLLELGGHSHWVWRAQYNPQHDQLVATSSSDSLVNLYYTPGVAAASGAPGSSATESDTYPTGGTRSGALGAGPRGAGGDLDGKAHTYDEHEDSVYGLAWSGIDPWLFASMSYDGRVVLNKVPKQTKYKILL